MLEEFKRIGSYLFGEGLVSSHAGSMSVRHGDKIFITRQDAMLGDLKEGDIVEVGLTGEAAGASSELPAHRAIYKETKAEAIVRAFPPQAIAISITDNKIVPQDGEGLRLLHAAAIVRSHQPVGSDETVRLLPSFLQGTSVVAVVKGQGSFAIGKNLEEAYKYTSVLECSCKILVAIRSSGGTRPSAPVVNKEKPEHHRRSAIPPGIGVMDRSRYHKR
ncbi:MAG: class II aldolase/adducin family protein [Candidatus Margulisbacteria bacterium]|nr:class II aldolase/adducin family protein [Candidatus Margulisiibacteriota bacterium]MBU1617675.1 class II aldolase/adducin family protein [Candidatus Margulisiibacteriota bacterium]